MRSRYYRDAKGKPTIKALLYEQADHGISRLDIDVDARKICSLLSSRGHQAYIVGGAVRDLLLGRTPKDFDIATDASPARVRRLFRNSRVIGKRFRLVHIYFQGGKIHEVATFRSPESGDRNHVFGTLFEDVMRRDFSFNALYYDPEEEIVLDFVGGVKDIRKGVVSSVLPLKESFVEDPVRMLRAVKYAVITGMSITPAVGRRILKDAPLLATASLSRLSEELYKILNSGHAESILRLMERYRIFDYLLPGFSKIHSNEKENQILRESTYQSLAKLDKTILNEGGNRAVMIRYLCEEALVASASLDIDDAHNSLFADAVRDLKDILKPLVQPNRDIEEAVRLIFRDRDLPIPKKRSRHPGFWIGASKTKRAAADGTHVRRQRRRRNHQKLIKLGD